VVLVLVARALLDIPVVVVQSLVAAAQKAAVAVLPVTPVTVVLVDNPPPAMPAPEVAGVVVILVLPTVPEAAVVLEYMVKVPAEQLAQQDPIMVVVVAVDPVAFPARVDPPVEALPEHTVAVAEV